MDLLRIILENYRYRRDPEFERIAGRFHIHEIEISRPQNNDMLEYCLVEKRGDGKIRCCNVVSESAIRSDFFGMLNAIHDWLDNRGPDPGAHYYRD